MLLPSDVARLVLGYLQQEGLTATSRAFIVESPNLREYAEHTSEDGLIPACVFSLFGKNLTTILNEYVAVKAKETCQENQIPAMMTSLWKKLDFTLNQIKSMQNSPGVQHIQRLRTHNSIQNMRRLRALSSSQIPVTGVITVSSPGNCVASSLVSPQVIQGHSTSVCYTSPQTRPSTISLPQPGESPLQIIVPDNRLTPGPLSPARRKCDSPRRRSGSQFGASRNITVSSTVTVESQSQEVLTENLSQMVIENAREKILNDRSLQEKLAENINKILASDNSPQMLKAACSAVEQEQSIDEILGLQGEIHMTDDAIQDILEQTESDPAFQALFDLFDYGKGKTAEAGEHAEGSNSALESDEPGRVDSATDAGTGLEDSTSGGETISRNLRNTNVKDAKSKRKSLGKPVPAPSQSCEVAKQTATIRGGSKTKKSTSRIQTSVNTKQIKGKSSSSREQPYKKTQSKSSSSSSSSYQNTSSCTLSEEETSMEIDDLTQGPSLVLSTQRIPQPVVTETSSTQSSASTKQAVTTPEVGANILGVKSGVEEEKRTQEAAEQKLGTPEASGQSINESPTSGQQLARNGPAVSGQQPATNSTALAGHQPGTKDTTIVGQQLASNDSSLSGQQPGTKDTALSDQQLATKGTAISDHQPAATGIATTGQKLGTNDIAIMHQQPATNKSPLVAEVTQEKQATASSSEPVLSEPLTPIVSGSVATTASSLTGSVSNSQTAESDPSKVVALKIIVSEEEDRNSDTVLNQAVSSITGDRIPTIFLSSPTKSPAKAPLAPAKLSITAEETAQAVNSLQGAEAAGDRVLSAPNNLQPSPARALGREPGFIQLFPASQTFRGASSYLVVTDSGAAVDQHTSVMLLPVSTAGGASPAHHVAAAVPRTAVALAPNMSQSFLPASTIISPPVQPMLQNMAVPVPVTEQNSTGQVTMVPNQMLPLPGSTLVDQPAKVVSKPAMVPKDNVDLGKIGTSGSSQSADHLKSATAASPGHRRILYFDESSSNSNTSTTSTSRAERNQPCVIGSSNGKRRIETIRLPEPSPSLETKEMKKPSIPPCQEVFSKSFLIETDSVSTNGSSDNVTQKESSVPSNKEGGAPSTSDPARVVKSSSRRLPETTDIVKDTSKGETHERRPSESPEGLSESITQNSPNVTANKENEAEGGLREPCQVGAPSLRTSAPVPQGGSGKSVSKTSPLTKQAAEMLQDIQSHSPISTPPRRRGTGTSDLPLPRTPGPGRIQEDFLDGLRTPLRQRHGHEADGTPKHAAPPATPDLPSCSPASEAGSENSINMAAHTLMILSRAARKGGPLKDSLRQEEVGTDKSGASKGKKRKHAEQSPPAKKELQLSSSSGSKKKAKKEKKKLLDSFPHDLDVDKFLSSLHYDE